MITPNATNADLQLQHRGATAKPRTKADHRWNVPVEEEIGSIDQSLTHWKPGEMLTSPAFGERARDGPGLVDREHPGPGGGTPGGVDGERLVVRICDREGIRRGRAGHGAREVGVEEPGRDQRGEVRRVGECCRADRAAGPTRPSARFPPRHVRPRLLDRPGERRDGEREQHAHDRQRDRQLDQRDPPANPRLCGHWPFPIDSNPNGRRSIGRPSHSQPSSRWRMQGRRFPASLRVSATRPSSAGLGGRQGFDPCRPRSPRKSGVPAGQSSFGTSRRVELGMLLIAVAGASRSAPRVGFLPGCGVSIASGDDLLVVLLLLVVDLLVVGRCCAGPAWDGSLSGGGARPGLGHEANRPCHFSWKHL